MSTTTTLDPAILSDALDRQAIGDLVSGVGVWLDERRFGDAPDLFTDDVRVSTPGGTTSGIDATVAQARGNHGRLAATHHMATNVLVALDGDRATASANGLAMFLRDADDLSKTDQHPIRYSFALRRTPAGWRIAEMEIRQAWRS